VHGRGGRGGTVCGAFAPEALSPSVRGVVMWYGAVRGICECGEPRERCERCWDLLVGVRHMVDALLWAEVLAPWGAR
jgi:hypothetical protein